jgi:hypothetical protein
MHSCIPAFLHFCISAFRIPESPLFWMPHFASWPFGQMTFSGTAYPVP